MWHTLAASSSACAGPVGTRPTTTAAPAVNAHATTPLSIDRSNRIVVLHEEHPGCHVSSRADSVAPQVVFETCEKGVDVIELGFELGDFGVADR